LLYSLSMDRTENTASNSSSVVACISVAAVMWQLLNHCLAMAVSAGFIVPVFCRHATVWTTFHKHRIMYHCWICWQACERLLAYRVEMKVKTKKVDGVLNRLHVAMPTPRDEKARPPCIPGENWFYEQSASVLFVPAIRSNLKSSGKWEVQIDGQYRGF
jgi:hypothetical protein